MTIEHDININRSDAGHWAFCACGYKGRRRLEVEHALFDASDHRARHLCRRLRSRDGWKLLPAGKQMWPWLLANQHRIAEPFGGELAAIVGLVDKHLAEYVPTPKPAKAPRPVLTMAAA